VAPDAGLPVLLGLSLGSGGPGRSEAARIRWRAARARVMARAWVWLIDRKVDWVRAPAISRAGCFRDVRASFGAEASIPGTATAHLPVNVAGTAENRQFGAEASIVSTNEAYIPVSRHASRAAPNSAPNCPPHQR
jgi:hypothetical protein